MIESIFSTPLYYNFAEDQKLIDIQTDLSSVIDDIKLFIRSAHNFSCKPNLKPTLC